MTDAAHRTVVVDGNNVMGATADGWWRDRPGAVRRLLARLQCYARSGGDRIVLVLDVPQADLPEGDHDGVTVQYARRRGRNAADDRIRELLGELDVAVVVTSDRALADDVRATGVEVSGARSLLTRVEAAGC
ncbi:MAG: hypothetical protein JWP02_2730 [Acidimicrobiales bacterium]|nr:hypothetical protein [Acidimicrobiales bacterium]